MVNQLAKFGWTRLFKLTTGLGFVVMGMVSQDNIASLLGAMLLFQGGNLNFCMTGTCASNQQSGKTIKQNDTIIH